MPLLNCIFHDDDIVAMEVPLESKYLNLSRGNEGMSSFSIFVTYIVVIIKALTSY